MSNEALTELLTQLLIASVPAGMALVAAWWGLPKIMAETGKLRVEAEVLEDADLRSDNEHLRKALAERDAQNVRDHDLIVELQRARLGLEAENAALRVRVGGLEAENAALRDQVAEHADRITALEAALDEGRGGDAAGPVAE